MENKLIPFGKYKGQPLEVLQNDKQYLDWLMVQDWFKERYPQYVQIIVNNFTEPSETPEHNQLQGLFLDEDFCIKFARFAIRESFANIEKGESWIKEHTIYLSDDPSDEELKLLNSSEYKNAEKTQSQRDSSIAWVYGRGKSTVVVYKNVHQLKGIDKIKTSCLFEDKGVDVKLFIEATYKEYYINNVLQKHVPNDYEKHKAIYIEIKPIVSDDYPAILRQMKANQSTVLFTTAYAGRGITLDQLKKLFANEGRKIIIQNEL